MLVAEYNYEKDISVKQAEAREEGRKRGREEGRESTAITMIKLGKLSIAEISLYSGLSENRVKELEKEIDK